VQKLAEICIRRPVFASMLILALVVVGSAAYFKLGVDRLPSVDLPTVSVRTSLPGAAPEEVETEVTEIIEEAVNTVEGIDELRSISGPGSSIVIATFNLNRNVDVAAQDVRDRVSAVLRRLPDEVDPPIIAKFNNDSQPVITIAMSGERATRELTELADKVVKRQLERSAGVGEVAIVGGLERSMNVWADADKLVSYGIPITAVRDAIRNQNAEVPGGNVTGSVQERSLRTAGRLTDEREFNDLVLAVKNGQPVRVRDIGRAEDGTKEPRSLASLNGEPAVVLEVRRQSGANTVAVIEGVKKKLAEILPQLPSDVKLEVIRDQSKYIHAALHEINVHLVLGSILACLVVLAFMRNWRSTLIAGVAIPSSVIATFGMMWALNFTLNSVTMLALVLMVGVVIDDAIVVLENIFRFVEEKKMSPRQAAREATAEIGLAVLATTLSLVVIFIPVSFMSSISGRFLYQFGITAAVAVMVSLLVSFTLTPMMSSRMLRRHDAGGRDGNGDARHGHSSDHGAKSRSGFYGAIDWAYERMLVFSMRHRVLVTGLALLVVAASVPLYRAVKQEYVPSDVDEAEFSVGIEAPEGTSFAAMSDTMRVIDDELRGVRGVRTVLSTIGGRFLAQVNNADVHVRIAPHEERVFSVGRLWRETLAGHPLNAFRGNYTQRDVMVEVRQRLSKFRDVRPRVASYPSFNIGGGNFDIDFVIKGPDLVALNDYGERLRQKTKEVGGIVDATTTLRLNKPELRVEIDRKRAADLGVAASDVGTALRLMVGGDDQLSRFRDPVAGEDYDVQLRLSERDRNDPSKLSRLYLPRDVRRSGEGAAGTGTADRDRSGELANLVELGNIATVKPILSASRIDRIDRQRQIGVRAMVAPGYALGDRMAALRQAAAELDMPSAYTTAVSGRGRELERTFGEFLWAFLLSVILMYIILAMNYESLVHPVTILLSLPLTVPFALLSLWLTGGTLNLFSALGLLVLFGVVKKNSILQIDHMNGLRAAGMGRFDAIIQGNRDRLRPILMTTLALVAGMLPLWVGTGPGAEERRAVAVVVIGGQTLSLLLTLLVTPVAYSLLDDVGAAVARRRGPRRAEAREEDEPAPATVPGGAARRPVGQPASHLPLE
jgi:HAE1 family hydrophobic/amphiphilic exporter-1